MTPIVLPFSELTLDALPLVGGKNASLGELIRTLAPAGIRVPIGFALTVEAYRAHLDAAGLTGEVERRLNERARVELAELRTQAESIRAQILTTPLPTAVREAAFAEYREISRRYGEAATDVAVRSSATTEDLPNASFAGQHETFLNVRGEEHLDRAIRGCFASLFTDRAIAYRAQRGIPERGVALSVGVQKMVRSDLGAAGVIFTLDTESGLRDVVLVTGAWGLGESVVQGKVNPDEFWVHKTTLRAGHRPILRKELGEKATRLVYGDADASSVREERVPWEDRQRFVLTDDDVLELSRWALEIEDHYSSRAGRPTPMDIEWARDGRSGEMFIVQARPETVHSQRRRIELDLFELKGTGRVLVTGKSVGSKIACGRVRVVHGKPELDRLSKGEVLVTAMTDPDWEPVLERAVAVVTDQGGRTCHAAIVSRELGLPCVVGTGVATAALRDGQTVTVSCAQGDVGRVFEDEIPFTRESLDPTTLPVPRVPLMLNLANPDLAFMLAQLPTAGVGLLRIEFLVSNWIGVHPLALVHPDRVADAAQLAEIRRRVAGHADPPQFFVDRLASGISVITAAFHPRPVIVRFSDFKTNEYAGLLGGAAFEPHEDNPMIGFRGASRYYDERYREGFALECRAIRKVREDMGLRNLLVMVPFCRTIAEARSVLAEMEKHGLARGADGLEVYVMCEIPNNVILAEEFSALFDGFSIGSNDLTQLTLGVDRDSELLTHLFDEKDPGVKKMIQMVVAAAHRCGRKVGICGQAPSDDPAFADWIAGLGIDSISLTPDALPKVAKQLAR